MNAAHLIYPIAAELRAMDRYLSRRPPFAAGALAVEVIRSLERALKDARALTPYDPTGL